MKLFGKKRLPAFLAALAMACTMWGMTAFAGATGLGAVSLNTEQGPGMEQEGQTEENGGQAQEAEASGAQEGADAGAPAADTSQGSLQVNYSAFFYGTGWSSPQPDNTLLRAPAGSWATAVKANLINIPQGAQVGITYQVNLSGQGWLDWASDGAETGGTAGAMPLEALRAELYGSSAEGYDLYYQVFQNGAWTDWAMNGAAAGTEGAGLRVDGIRMGIVPKGANPPETPVPSGADPTRPMIALTFDDGPRTAVTSRILDSLQQYGGRATFFMLGSNVNANADVIRRMAAQGCEVANHTHDHKYISRLSADQIVSQVAGTSQKIQAVCGVAPTLLRPPGGYYNDASLAVLGSMGMPAVMWSIDTRDWQHRNAQRTIDTVLSQVKDGDIILMHDIYEATADAAQVLIPELTARGYQLVTVSELAACRGGMVPGHRYSQFWP